MIDAHAHLDACEEPVSAVLGRARAAGVTSVVTIGTGIDSCRAALAIADAEAGVVAALGIDPHQAATPEAQRVGELRELLGHPRAVAVGEAGLDGFHGADTLDEQRTLFAEQLELAADLALPIVVHCRETADETAAMLAGFPGPVVLHCFSEPSLLELALTSHWYVSFAGNVTYPKASELREAATAVPADRLLLETDSPYLAPQPVRGRRNEPAHLRHTLTVVAAARGADPDTLEAQIDDNARDVFGL